MDDDTPAPRLPQGNDVVRRSYESRAVLEPQAPKTDRHLVDRDDGRPFSFDGQLIGFNKVDEELPRGTRVTVFVTKSGKIITAVFQWQRDESRDRSRRAAAIHTTPDEALAWLIQDGGGHLGRCSREAWEMACKTWVPFQGLDVEVVE